MSVASIPVVEATYNITVGGRRVRLWVSQRGDPHMDAAKSMVEFVCNLLHTNPHATAADLIDTLSSEFPGIAAIEIQAAPSKVLGRGFEAEVTHGVVAYVEWP